MASRYMSQERMTVLTADDLAGYRWAVYRPEASRQQGLFPEEQASMAHAICRDIPAYQAKVRKMIVVDHGEYCAYGRFHPIVPESYTYRVEDYDYEGDRDTVYSFSGIRGTPNGDRELACCEQFNRDEYSVAGSLRSPSFRFYENWTSEVASYGMLFGVKHRRSIAVLAAAVIDIHVWIGRGAEARGHCVRGYAVACISTRAAIAQHSPIMIDDGRVISPDHLGSIMRERMAGR